MNTVGLKTPGILITLFLSCLIFGSQVLSDNNFVNNPFGFNFGMSSKDAKKLIKNNGNSILKNEIDSKDIRTILFEGVIVDYPGIENTDKKTELEFYNDKLMSTILVVKGLSGNQYVDILNKLQSSIEAEFGEPSSRDNMLSYDIWTWRMEHLKLILSANRNKGQVKIDYTYVPIANVKVENELEVKRKGEIKSPTDQMFKDGNYSQQTGPQTLGF